jgi:hypothetical protein
MKNPAAAMFALSAVVALTVPAGALPGEAGSHETLHLKIATSAAPETVAPGKRASLIVDVTPKPKMHVYAPGQPGYISIALTLDPDPAFTAGKPKYPAGEKILIKILNETQLVYAKPFRITQDVTPSGHDPAGGDLTIKGTLLYQACDDTICYLPVKVPLAWTVKLAAPQ